MPPCTPDPANRPPPPNRIYRTTGRLRGRAGFARSPLAVPAALLLVACGARARYEPSRIGVPPVPEEGAAVPDDIDPDWLRGEASWYGAELHGETTASGEPFDMYEFTGAHRHLPFGSIVRVTRDDTLQSVVVRINDRGPYSEGRIIDLSWAAAWDLGIVEAGVVAVHVDVLAWGDGQAYGD